MLGRIFSLLACSVIVAGLVGCRQISVAEVLQQPVGKKLYLKKNIWYEDPKDISCLNIQKGKILNFGTEIESVHANDYKLTFKTVKDGKTFTINYSHSLIMLPMEGFIQHVYSMKTRAQMTKGMKASHVKLMLAGKVKRGMTKKQVLLACGTPPACRTPSTINSTWVYWLDEDSVYRVVFRGKKVNAIVNIDAKPRKYKKKKTKKTKK